MPPLSRLHELEKAAEEKQSQKKVPNLVSKCSVHGCSVHLSANTVADCVEQSMQLMYVVDDNLGREPSLPSLTTRDVIEKLPVRVADAFKARSTRTPTR